MSGLLIEGVVGSGQRGEAGGGHQLPRSQAEVCTGPSSQLGHCWHTPATVPSISTRWTQPEEVATTTGSCHNNNNNNNGCVAMAQ